MKNLIIIILAVGIALSSCTSSKNGVVLKRKYNKGYYVDVNSKNNGSKTTVNSVAKKTETQQSTNDKVAIYSETKNKNVSLSGPETSGEVKSTKKLPLIKTILEENGTNPEFKKTYTAVKTEVDNLKHNTILVDPKNVTASSSQQTKIKTKNDLVKVDNKKAASSESDGRLVLLVILSLFPIFALLAMYLKDGNKVTLNFWIDLLLHFTFVGYIIFALLVVFDIINLAK